MANGFDPSLEDIGVSLGQPGGWDAFSDAEDVGVSSDEIDMGMAGGGQPGPAFGGHTGAGVGYYLDQIEAELNAQAVREVEAEEELENELLANIINPTSYDDIIGSATFRDPNAALNKGHFLSLIHI